MPDGPKGEYLTDRLADESIKFINNSLGNPFFLYLSLYTVHTPIEGCIKYDDLYLQKSQTLPDSGKVQTEKEHEGLTRTNQSNPKYAAMVRSMDENVGRIIQHLNQTGLAENTVLIFTSDNGGLSTLKRPGPTSVRPLRAGKGWCYEGGIRVPLIIKAPTLKNPGRHCAQPVISMDLYPTLLELANISLLPDQHQDGLSLTSLIMNPDISFRRLLTWHFPHYHGSTWRPGSAIRQGDWKLIQYYENQEFELYNLSTDLQEQSNLSLERPQKAKELQELLHRQLRDMGAKFPSNLSR